MSFYGLNKTRRIFMGFSHAWDSILMVLVRWELEFVLLGLGKSDLFHLKRVKQPKNEEKNPNDVLR